VQGQHTDTLHRLLLVGAMWGERMKFVIISAAVITCILSIGYSYINADEAIQAKWFIANNIWVATYFLYRQYRQKSQKKD
jgi:hypothetical protein